MADTLKDFLVGIGFAVDTSGAKKAEDAVAKTEAKISATSAAESAKRTAVEETAGSKRVGIVQNVGRILAVLEQDRADRVEKIKKDEAVKDEKRQEEIEKRSRERRAKALKSLQDNAVKMAAFALKAVAAVEGVALGIVVATDKAAKSFERLNYAAKMAGASPSSMTAAGYAASQLGSSPQAADAALNALGTKLKTFPGYAEALSKFLGKSVRDANGNLKDTGELLADIGDKLRQVEKQGGRTGRANALNYARLYGVDDPSLVNAIESPDYRKRMAEQQGIDAKTGANRGDAASGGTAFEQSMRRLEAVFDSVKTKVETGLFKTLQPQLDTLAKWGTEHGEQVADIIGRVADDIVKLANAVIDQLSKVNWDKVLGDIENFGKEFDKRTKDIFGENGPLIATFAAFGLLVGSKLLGPLNLVLATLETIGKVPLVGRLMGLNPATIGAAVVGSVLASGDPNKAVLSGGHPDVKAQDNDLGLPGTDAGTGDRTRSNNRSSGIWGWIQARLGIGDEDHRVKDAILQTAEATKKLADGGSGTGGDSVNSGHGANLGSGAPNLRYGRKSGGGAGSYRGTPVPDAPYNGKNIEGLSEAGSKQYAGILGNRESGNRYGSTNSYGYAGRWQFGASALVENGYVKPGTTNAGLRDPGNWTGKGGAGSLNDWLANKGGVQDQAFGEYTNRHYAQLKKAGVIRDGMGQSEIAGWLAAAHLKGVGGAIALSKGHDNVDANGTSASSYRRMMAGVGAGSSPTAQAPVPAGTSAKAITDAEVFAARQRILNGSRDPKDRALVDQYKTQQNTPVKVEISKVHEDAVKGMTPFQRTLAAHHNHSLPYMTRPHVLTSAAARTAIDNSRRRGDTHLARSDTYHFHGANGASMLAEAKRQAGRGDADLVRNLNTAEV